MSAVLVPLLSITALAALAWAVRRSLGLRLCPICVGVAGTWLWMLIGRESGGTLDASLLPYLMGGSVVGIAYQLENRLPAGRAGAVWKSLAIPIGFVAVYGLEQHLWGLLMAALAVLVGVAAFFFRPTARSAGESAAVEKLEEQMKQCC